MGGGRPWKRPGPVAGKRMTQDPQASQQEWVGGTRSGQCQTDTGPVHVCYGGLSGEPQRTRKKGCREFLTPLCPLRTGSCGRRRLKVKGLGKK